MVVSDQCTEDRRFRNVFVCSRLFGRAACAVVVVMTAVSDTLGYLQVLHKTILVSPWEGREWPY